MPCRFRVVLAEDEVHPHGLPPHTGPALHAAFLGGIRRVSAAAAAELHERWPPPKPFCLTPLERHGRHWAFEVAVLDDQLGNLVADALWSLGRVRFGSSWLAAQGVDAVTSSHEELADQARPRDRWTFEFRSPTTFRSRFGGAERNWPVPIPYVILKNLSQRWERYAPELPLPASFRDTTANHLALHRLDGVATRPHMTSAPDGYVVGFVGTVEIGLADAASVPSPLRRAIDLMVGYTAATSVGDQTTKGMGWVTSTPDNNRRTRGRGAQAHRN